MDMSIYRTKLKEKSIHSYPCVYIAEVGRFLDQGVNIPMHDQTYKWRLKK